MKIQEAVLSTNLFGVADTITDKHAIGNLLTRILLLVPGTNPLYPDMGVGIGSVYRFINEDDLNMLKMRIEKQIQKYLPKFQYVTIELEIDTSNFLTIKITLDDIVYVYNTNETDTPVEVNNS